MGIWDPSPLENYLKSVCLIFIIAEENILATLQKNHCHPEKQQEIDSSNETKYKNNYVE